MMYDFRLIERTNCFYMAGMVARCFLGIACTQERIAKTLFMSIYRSGWEQAMEWNGMKGEMDGWMALLGRIGWLAMN